MSDYTPTTDDVVREKIAALSSDALRDVAYSCGRVWEAWQYGTMTQDDFSPEWEDEELLASIADALLPLIIATRTAALEKLEGVEYGRQKRESGKVFALRGPPRPDWWGESQEDYEHVQRLVGRWIPATPAGQEAT